MAYKRVQDLTQIGTIDTGSLVYLVQSGNPYKGTINDLINVLSLYGGSGGLMVTNPINANCRFSPQTGLQFYNFTTNLWHTILCVNNPPQIAWDSGSL